MLDLVQNKQTVVFSARVGLWPFRQVSVDPEIFCEPCWPPLRASQTEARGPWILGAGLGPTHNVHTVLFSARIKLWPFGQASVGLGTFCEPCWIPPLTSQTEARGPWVLVIGLEPCLSIYPAVRALKLAVESPSTARPGPSEASEKMVRTGPPKNFT